MLVGDRALLHKAGWGSCSHLAYQRHSPRPAAWTPQRQCTYYAWKKGGGGAIQSLTDFPVIEITVTLRHYTQM